MSRVILPDPWIPLEPYSQAVGYAALSTPASGTLVGTGNRALFLPIVFPYAATVTALRTIGGNTTGNYDLGFYVADPLTNAITRVASTGSTGLSVAILELALDYRVVAGRLYFAALALSSTAGTVVRPNYSANAGIAVGGFAQDSALPLPSTATPTAYAQNVFPQFAFGIR